VAYDSQAQEFAYSFYAKGWSKLRAVSEIRKIYPGFSGSTWDEWERKLGWRERRAVADAKLREFEDLVRDTARMLLLELDEIRKNLYLRVKGGSADTQTVYAYTSVVKQIAEISRQHLAGRDGDRVAMDVLNAAFERLLSELRDVAGIAKPLEEHAGEVGRIVAAVAEQFGREKRTA
jgi:hypothetical protein